MKKIVYTCNSANCCSSCPGLFDPNNDPVCEQKDGTYTYYLGGLFSKMLNKIIRRKNNG